MCGKTCSFWNTGFEVVVGCGIEDRVYDLCGGNNVESF